METLTNIAHYVENILSEKAVVTSTRTGHTLCMQTLLFRNTVFSEMNQVH